MPQFAMRADWQSREDDEIMDIGDAAAGTACRNPMEGPVRSSFEERIQRRQRPVLFMPGSFSVYLLKAEDVGAEPFELGSENIRALFDCDAGPRLQLEILKIERGNAH
jgi:hypothetical protein